MISTVTPTLPQARAATPFTPTQAQAHPDDRVADARPWNITKGAEVCPSPAPTHWEHSQPAPADLAALVHAAAQLLAERQSGESAATLGAVEQLWRSGAVAAPANAPTEAGQLLALFVEADQAGIDPTDILEPVQDLLVLMESDPVD